MITLHQASAGTTSGPSSSGIVATSISGNGGTASGAHATAGSGGNGGNSGNVTVSNAGTITPRGDSARGIVAQTIAASGRGGYSYGVFKSSGSSDAASGTAGTTAVTNSGTITTYGSNAYSVLLQSIGGAGGQAGGSFDTVGGSASDTPHQSGGGTVLFTADGGSIVTDGFGAFGVLGQSIGGGGASGDSSANASVLGYNAPGDVTSLAVTATLSVGGNGGYGGTGGEILVALGGTLGGSGNFTADPDGSAPTAITLWD